MNKLKAKRWKRKGRVSSGIKKKVVVERKTEMELLCHELRRLPKLLLGLKAVRPTKLLLHYMWWQFPMSSKSWLCSLSNCAMCP